MAYCQLLCAGHGFPLFVPRTFFDNVGMSLVHAQAEPRVCGYLWGQPHLLGAGAILQVDSSGRRSGYFSETLMDSSPVCPLQQL